MVKKYAFVIGLAQALFLLVAVKESTPLSMDFLLMALAAAMAVHAARNTMEFVMPYLVTCACIAAVRWAVVVWPVSESSVTTVSALCVCAGVLLIFQALVAPDLNKEAESPAATT